MSHPARRLAGLVVLGLVVGLLPGVATAHDYENPGTNGARLYVDMIEGEVPPVGNDVLVRGMDFSASKRVQIFQCPISGPNDPRVDCVVAGTAETDAEGGFQTDVAVSAGMPTKNTYCAPIGDSQCQLVAGTYDLTTGTATSHAEHHLCFGTDFAWVFFPGAYYPTRVPFEECAGPPEIVIPTTTTQPPPEWEPGPPMGVSRSELAATTGADGRIYALGGFDAGSGTRTNSAEVMDPCGERTWSPITPMTTARNYLAAATGPDGRIYAIGGLDADGTALSSVEAYDPTTNTWSPVASLAVPRSRLAATTGPDGRIYAIGGYVAGGLREGTSPGEAVPTVEAYDPDLDLWTPVTPLSAPNGFPGAATTTDGRVFAIFGQHHLDLYEPQLDDTPVSTGVEWYAPGPAETPGVWRKAAAPDGERYGLRVFRPYSAVTTGPDGLIYVSGGSSSGPLRVVWVYDPAADTWTPSPAPMISPRSFHAAAPGKDGRLYVIGGNGQSSTESLQVAPSSCPPGPMPPADFDGDDDTDVSVFRPATGTWFAKDGSTMAYGAQGDIPVPADYDGDRVTDVAVFRPSVGLWAIHRSSDDTNVFVSYGTGTDVPVPADYDGDGEADVAIYRPESATWWVRHSSTGLDVPATFGIATDVAVPADYDGDAKADMAVFRDGTWFTLPSSGASFLTSAYGAPGDVPVPADYDADRVIDRAVFRPSGSTWSLHRSSDGTDETFTFGTAGDIPQPGDYNADGVTDPALYRNGQWFIETGAEHSWGIATDIPLPLPDAIRRAYFGNSP